MDFRLLGYSNTLLEERTGRCSCSNYAKAQVQLRILQSNSAPWQRSQGWNKTALLAVFREGLNVDLKAEMACCETNVSLSQYITTAIRLDNLCRQHRRPVTSSDSMFHHPLEYHSPRAEITKPMQVGRSRVSDGERCTQLWHCFYCGKPGHQVFQYPQKPSQVEFVKPAFKVFFLLNDCRYSVTALIDSGEAVNLIDIELMWELGISTVPCTPPLRVTSINDQPIRKGLITHHTVQFNVQIGLFHCEKLHFFILSSPSNPVVFQPR